MEGLLNQAEGAIRKDKRASSPSPNFFLQIPPQPIGTSGHPHTGRRGSYGVESETSAKKGGGTLVRRKGQGGNQYLRLGQQDDKRERKRLLERTAHILRNVGRESLREGKTGIHLSLGCRCGREVAGGEKEPPAGWPFE